MKKTKKSFEKNMDRITEIAGKLDEGSASLSDSIKLYKEAVIIIQDMQYELETAKADVVIMRKGTDGIFTKEEEFKDEF